MSETITDMFTGEQKPAPCNYPGEPSIEYNNGWLSCLNGLPRVAPIEYMPSEAADFYEGVPA